MLKYECFKDKILFFYFTQLQVIRTADQQSLGDRGPLSTKCKAIPDMGKLFSVVQSV
jgi:hypothetical protein